MRNRSRSWPRLVAAAAALFLGSASAGRAQEHEHYQVFIAPFQITGLAKAKGAERAPLNSSLLEAAQNRGNFLEVVLPKDILKETLTATDDVEKLLSTLSGKADLLLYPTVTRDADQWLVRFQLYDLQTSRLLDSQSIKGKGSLDDLISKLWEQTDSPVLRWKFGRRHEVDVTSVALRGKFLTSFDSLGVGNVFNIESGKFASTFSNSGDSLLLDGTAGLLTLQRRDGRIQFWDLNLTKGLVNKKETTLLKSEVIDLHGGPGYGKTYVPLVGQWTKFVADPKVKKEDLKRSDFRSMWVIDTNVVLADTKVAKPATLWEKEEILAYKHTPQVRLSASPGHRILSILYDGKPNFILVASKKPVYSSEFIKTDLSLAVFGNALPSGRYFWACAFQETGKGIQLYPFAHDTMSMPYHPSATLPDPSKETWTRRIVFSPDGTLLVAAKSDTKTYWTEVWRVSGRPTLLARLAEMTVPKASSYPPPPLAFDPTGRFLATCYPVPNDVAVYELWPNRP